MSIQNLLISFWYMMFSSDLVISCLLCKLHQHTLTCKFLGEKGMMVGDTCRSNVLQNETHMMIYMCSKKRDKKCKSWGQLRADAFSKSFWTRHLFSCQAWMISIMAEYFTSWKRSYLGSEYLRERQKADVFKLSASRSLVSCKHSAGMRSAQS